MTNAKRLRRRHARIALREAKRDAREAGRRSRDAEHALKREHYRRAGQGSECDAEWYDNHYTVTYEREDDPLSPIADPMYYPSWRKVISWLGEGERVIDLGCGHGGFARAALGAGISYQLGVDFSEVAIKWAQARNPEYAERFKVHDISKPSVMELVEFDTAVILETLEHLNGDLQVLSNIPEGKRVILSVPSYGGRAHVRYFDTPEGVVARYEQVLSVSQSEAVVVGANGQTLWLLDGVRTNG